MNITWLFSCSGWVYASVNRKHIVYLVVIIGVTKNKGKAMFSPNSSGTPISNNAQPGSIPECYRKS